MMLKVWPGNARSLPLNWVVDVIIRPKVTKVTGTRKWSVLYVKREAC